MRTARIVMPKTARKGEVVEIKTLITHPMESGQRRDNVGKAVPRDIINKFRVTYGGEEVFAMDLFPAVAANPFISFTTVATETGEVVFTWTDDHGQAHTERATLAVT